MLTLQRILALLLLLVVYVKSAPTQQDASYVSRRSTTEPNPAQAHPGYEPTWFNGPTRRGTVDVIFPCMLTLLLCAWTAVHSNIEPYMWEARYKRRLSETQTKVERDAQIPASTTAEFTTSVSKLHQNLNYNKVLWSVMTLLFPEIALLVAAHERRTAKLLLAEMKEVTKENTTEWDITLSYYAVMGGFVVVEDKSGRTIDPRNRSSTECEKVRPHDSIDRIRNTPRNTRIAQEISESGATQQRLTLTPRGVLHLAQSKILVSYPSSHRVRDKSKVNRLAKFLVCFQAIWTIIQVLSRYASKLPVTLLELYTILHTFCAVAMYVVWINKPFNVTQPEFVLVHPDVLRDLGGGGDGKVNGFNRFNNETEVFWHKDYTDCLTKRAGLGKLLFQQLWDRRGFGTGNLSKDLLLLFEAYEAVVNGGATFLWEAFGLSVVSITHGCLHLVAWEFNFPSEAERRLWKISSILTAVTVMLFCISMLVGILGKWVWGVVGRKRDGVPAKDENFMKEGAQGIRRNTGDTLRDLKEVGGSIEAVEGFSDVSDEEIPIQGIQRTRALSFQVYSTAARWTIFFYCFCFVLTIFPCVLARLYLLVESFISVRKLPRGSYDKVMWTNLLPHIA